MSKAITLTGTAAVKFVCPRCKGGEFGSRGPIGMCETRGGPQKLGPICTFEWSRAHDWRVFFRVDTGAAFASHAAFQSVICGRPYVGADPVAEALHELLEGVMQHAPTAGVVATWTREEQRRALAWASHEALLDGDELHKPRPGFIEQGAGTA